MAHDFMGKPVNGYIMEQFEAQKMRGREGFGVFDITNSRLIRATKEKKILGWLKSHPQPGLMFHHRYPTSTSNRKKACHPFSTKNTFDTNYVLVHNGHISNSRLLKAAHETTGIEYQSYLADEFKFNDSESLLWDVALYLEGQQDTLQAYGNIAFICLAIPKDKRKATKLYFGRNTNPLKMDLTDEHIHLSSEGEGEMIESDTLYCFNYKTKKLTTEPLTIPSGYASTSTTPYGGTVGNFPNWGNDPWGSSTQYWDSDEYDDESYAPQRIGGFELLPNDEHFEWSSLFPQVRSELYYPKDDGTRVAIRATVIERIENYLETVDGVYFDAYALLNYDLHVLRRQLRADRVFQRDDDEDLVLEIDMLEAAKEAFDTCYLWTNEEAVDPSYATV